MSTEAFKKGFDCGRLKALLPDYLDESLQNKVCDELRAHLEECEDCRVYVKTIETTIVLYKHYPSREVPEEIRIELRRNLRVEIEGRSREDDES